MELMNVLVVEDSMAAMQIVTKVLKQSGHRVVWVATIADAVESMLLTPPDLVILDLGLPDGDGLDLCRAIASDRTPTSCSSQVAPTRQTRWPGFRPAPTIM